MKPRNVLILKVEKSKGVPVRESTRDEWIDELLNGWRDANSPCPYHSTLRSGDSMVILDVDEMGSVWLSDVLIRRDALGWAG